MAHEVEQSKDGSYKAFYVVKPAWWDGGTVLSTAPTVEKAWEIAYPHTLFKMDLDAVLTDDDGVEHKMRLKNSKVIVRDDGLELATVGSDFELIQPYETLNFYRDLMDTGLIELEAGGSLRNGRIMWVTGKIKGSSAEVAKGDQVDNYVLFANGFDGAMRACITQTPLRTVCMNTLRSAIGNKGERADHKFKHTKNVRHRIDNAKRAIMNAITQFGKDTEAYRYLASKKVTPIQMVTYVKEVFLTEKELSGEEEVSNKKGAIVQSVIDLIDDQRGLDLVPAIRGTAWQAYNAVTEYVTHNHGRSVDTRLDGQWFGESAKLNQRALDIALTM